MQSHLQIKVFIQSQIDSSVFWLKEWQIIKIISLILIVLIQFTLPSFSFTFIFSSIILICSTQYLINIENDRIKSLRKINLWQILSNESDLSDDDNIILTNDTIPKDFNGEDNE